MKIRFEAIEWTLHHSSPYIWVKSSQAWYQLVNPSEQYSSYFNSMKKKLKIYSTLMSLILNGKTQYNLICEAVTNFNPSISIFNSMLF